MRIVGALVLLSICAPGLGCGSGSDGDTPTHTASSVPVPAGEGRIAGVVVANHHGCHLGTRCWLAVRTAASRTVVVVYHEGESPPCRNTAAVRAADPLRPGDRIEVHGRWRGSGAQRVLATCADPAYTIVRR